MNKQKERQQRGQDFQDELRRSWRLVPKCWRMRVADGRGATRPGDEIILLQYINVLAEHKRTKGTKFELGFLAPNQLKGLIDFDTIIDRNKGLVFVSFLDEAKGLDKAVAFRLVAAALYMKRNNRKYITLEEFESGKMPCLMLDRIKIDDKPGYDLKGVNSYFVTDLY